MATKPQSLPIPSAATPENVNEGAIPLSQYLDPNQVAPPYISLPAATGPGPVPVPPALLPSAPTPAPQDPNAGAIPLTAPTPNEGAIPLSGAPGLYTPEQIKGTDVAALVADKNFRPVDWLADAGQNALADPKLMEKVQDVYTQKLKTDKGALHDLIQLPLHPIKAAQSGIEVGKALAGAVGEIPAVIGRAAGRASTGDFQGAAGEVAAAAQALGSSERRDVNLLLKTLRGIKEKTGFGPETPEDYKKRLFFDLEMKKQENEARAGNGELSRALGVDTNSLKEAGITVNPEAVEKLSVIEDPINFIPVGSAVGAVGRFGKMVVAATTSAERAEQLAAVLNNAARVGATKTISGSGFLTEKLAGLAEAGGRATRTAPLGGSLGASLKVLGGLTEYGAKPFIALGKGVQKIAPVTGVIAAEGLKGAAEAAAITFPLTIGATPEEREALLGNVGLAAGLRAGGTAVGLGTRAAANWTRDKVAADLYKSVERAPTPESPSYGTDPDLDLAHDKQMQNTGAATKNVVNYFREFLRPSGIEVYAMDKGDFVKNVDPVGGAAKAKGYYVKRGVRVNPDGTQTPVNQIFLNGSADAIGHELFHAFEDVDPEGAAQLKTEIAKGWTPQESKEWKQTYESALNGGKQEKDWTHHLTDDELRSEAAAEVFGRVLDATDLTGVDPAIQKRTSRFLSNVLEKIGFPLGGPNQAAGPGVSELGVRATPKQFDAAQDFIGNLTRRVKETGSAIGTPKPAVPLTELLPGDISRKAPPPPPAPPVAGPTPAPTPAPTVPEVVVPVAPKGPQLDLGLGPTAPNIRVPASKQLDFAAKRAAVTNEVEAKAAADRLGKPEVQKVVNDVNTGIDAGLTAFEIEHKGVKSESTPEKPLARTPRRTEQEEAYVAESLGAVPEDVRASHQKVSSFVRWDVLKDGTPQFIGYSLDKAIANIEHLIRWSNEKGVDVPYSAAPESWREVVQDLTDYYNNQANGFRGDGKPFVRPTADIQVSLPPENPGYQPVQLSTAKVQFLNAAQGLPAPLTVREVKGKIPANVKAQLLNELQGGKPQAAILPEDIKKREFKTPVGGRKFEIAEVNPLRAEMVKADVPVRELIEVTERLNADDIVSATPRPDIAVKPGVTDIIRSGFLPSKPALETASDVLKATPEEWQKFFGPGGSLTRSAYELGLGLKSPEELQVLRAAQDKATVESRDLMTKVKSGNFDVLDAVSAAATKAQFFREAIEAATDTGSAAGPVGWRRAYPDAKPPFAEPGKFLPATKGEEGSYEALVPRMHVTGSENFDFQQVARMMDKGLTSEEFSDLDYQDQKIVRRIADFIEENSSSSARGYKELPNPKYKGVPASGVAARPIVSRAFRQAGISSEALANEFAAVPKEDFTSPEAMRGVVESMPIDTFQKAGGTEAVKRVLGRMATESIDQIYNSISADEWPIIRAAVRNWHHKIHPENFMPFDEAMKDIRSRLAGRFGEKTADEVIGKFGKFAPSADELKIDVNRRLDEKKKAGVPITDIVKRQAQQEAEFDVRRKGGLKPGEVAGFFSPAEDILTPETEYQQELDFAKTVITGARKLEDYPFYASYKKTVADEAKLLSDGSVVFVGSGPAPVSQILLEKELGRQVDGLDISSEAVKVGNQVLDKAGVKGKMYSGAGEQAPLGDYDNVIVALDAGTSPKAKGMILANIASQVKDDATVLVRSSIDKSFPQVGDSYEGLFTVEERIPTFDGLSETIKLKKVAGGSFLPKKKETEAEAQKRVEETDYSKYNVPLVAKPKTDKPTGWILPNGDYVPLDTDYHQRWLGENAEQLNTQFKTNFNAQPTVEDRLSALNAGFVRAREYGGKLVIEANQNFYKGKQKRAIEALLDKNAEHVDRVSVSLLNNEGQMTDSVSAHLVDVEDVRQAISDMLDRLNPVQTTSQKGPTAIQQARARPGYFLPQVGTKAYNEYAQERIKESKQFPEALPLAFRQDENGNYKAGFNGEPLMIAEDYDLLGTPLAKESKGKTAAETEETYTSALAKKLEKSYADAKKNADIAAGEKWYEVCREKLANLLGEDSKFFAELLGATSAQTAVDVNFGSAVEAYNQFKRGAFDALIEKYREGKKAFANGELAEFEKATGKTGKKATYDAFMAWWVEKYQLTPKKSNGKRFEMNSRAVMRVLDGSWSQQVKGPKTPNFTGNLTGSTFEATIDVWAARALHRLSNEGTKKRWRIQPANETGVSDIDFFIGQKAFRKAAKAIGIKPDALQAILWFAEKDRWEKNGWTKGIGSKKSDYNTLMSQTVKTSEGELKKVDNQLKLGNL